MIYRLMGRVHMRIAGARGRGERGQGTVEYVALILLVAALLAGVVAAHEGHEVRHRRHRRDDRRPDQGGAEEPEVALDPRRGPLSAPRIASAGSSASMCRMSATPRERPIAVFDSGVGGLTVLHELLVALPDEDFLYLGDTARFPYGDKSQEQLRAFALEIAEHLLALDAKLLVVACNSATAAALPLLQERLGGTGVDVFGVIEPEAELAVEATRSGRIGLLATPATVASGAYAAALAARDPRGARRERRVPGPGADHPERLPVRRARRRDRARATARRCGPPTSTR